jgi:hypothetical protein
MRLKMTYALLIVWISLSLVAPCADARHHGTASKDPISGEWTAVFHMPGNDVVFALKLKLDGDRVSGTVKSPHGKTPITNGSWSDHELRLTIDTLQVTGKLDGPDLAGEFDHGGHFHGKWEAQKKH